MGGDHDGSDPVPKETETTGAGDGDESKQAHDGDEDDTGDRGERADAVTPAGPVGIGLADSTARAETEPSDRLPPDAAEGLAYASPSLNRVEFHVHPDRETANGQATVVATQVKTLREELLHGERSHLGVARNVRLLDRRVQRLLEDLAAHGRSTTGSDPDADAGVVEETLASLSELRSRRAAITRAREPVVEAVDKFHVHALLDDEETVLEDLIDGRTSDQFIADAAREVVQRMIDSGEGDGYHDETVYDALERLYEASGWRVAEATATAAFDIPYLLAAVAEPARDLGIDTGGFETVPAAELRTVLDERFQIAVDVADGATADAPENATVTELADRIRSAIEERTDRKTPERTPSAVSLPLLDVPARRDRDAPPGADGSDATALDHVETPVGYFLAGAFRTAGDFGGALYVTPEGEWSWAINPWVADQPVDVGIDGVDTYDRLWAHAAVCHSVAAQLVDEDRSRVACSLCARSGPGTCGPEGCSFASLIDGVNAALAASGR